MHDECIIEPRTERHREREREHGLEQDFVGIWWSGPVDRWQGLAAQSAETMHLARTGQMGT